jgi:hypothetical protein
MISNIHADKTQICTITIRCAHETACAPHREITAWILVMTHALAPAAQFLCHPPVNGLHSVDLQELKIPEIELT